MKEYRIPSVTSILVAGAVWWGALAVISGMAGQAVLAVVCAAVAISSLWGTFKFGGSVDEAELRNRVRLLPVEGLATAKRESKAA